MTGACLGESVKGSRSLLVVKTPEDEDAPSREVTVAALSAGVQENVQFEVPLYNGAVLFNNGGKSALHVFGRIVSLDDDEDIGDTMDPQYAAMLNAMQPGSRLVEGETDSEDEEDDEEEDGAVVEEVKDEEEDDDDVDMEEEEEEDSEDEEEIATMIKERFGNDRSKESKKRKNSVEKSPETKTAAKKTKSASAAANGGGSDKEKQVVDMVKKEIKDAGGEVAMAAIGIAVSRKFTGGFKQLNLGAAKLSDWIKKHPEFTTKDGKVTLKK